MNRIDKKFRELKREGKKAFIAYITAGDPSLSVTKRIVLSLEESGADIVELGIPFSDPIADGPTIQAASHRALAGGVTLKKIFSMMGALRKTTRIPVAFMTYYNPVLKYGVEKFVKSCKHNGVDGVIIPDLPHEEAKDLIRCARREGVATIFLAAPTSTRKRIKDIVKSSTGFIYYVSLTGVTGARSKLPPEIASNVRAIKSMARKPVAVGFGISSPGQARDMARIADGVIVGSAIVKIVAANQKNSKMLILKISQFTKTLARGIHNA
ncbi:MAG: tryptophan synthase subunit alpha [Candidatus Omnitrophica bacterium]|nr:tryptophan synthase subunit alpha [Candidatus Omnitrophota bacterium]